MSKSDKTRIAEARSRISKFTLDNNHLANMIERLKIEIQIVEENKAKLLTDLQNSAGPDFEEDRKDDRTNSPEPDPEDSFLSHSTVNISDISVSITSSTDSDSVLNEDICNSASKQDYAPAKNMDKDIGSSQNVLECMSCDESLLSNLKVVKKCLRTNPCLNCKRIRNTNDSLQEINTFKRQLPNTNSFTSLTSNLYYISSFITLPFLLVLMCGYLGALAYAKQANSLLISTPPQ